MNNPRIIRTLLQYADEKTAASITEAFSSTCRAILLETCQFVSAEHLMEAKYRYLRDLVVFADRYLYSKDTYDDPKWGLWIMKVKRELRTFVMFAGPFGQILGEIFQKIIIHHARLLPSMEIFFETFPNHTWEAMHGRASVISFAISCNLPTKWIVKLMEYGADLWRSKKVGDSTGRVLGLIQNRDQYYEILGLVMARTPERMLRKQLEEVHPFKDGSRDSMLQFMGFIDRMLPKIHNLPLTICHLVVGLMNVNPDQLDIIQATLDKVETYVAGPQLLDAMMKPQHGRDPVTNVDIYTMVARRDHLFSEVGMAGSMLPYPANQLPEFGPEIATALIRLGRWTAKGVQEMFMSIIRNKSTDLDLLQLLHDTQPCVQVDPIEYFIRWIMQRLNRTNDNDEQVLRFLLNNYPLRVDFDYVRLLLESHLKEMGQLVWALELLLQHGATPNGLDETETLPLIDYLHNAPWHTKSKAVVLTMVRYGAELNRNGAFVQILKSFNMKRESQERDTFLIELLQECGDRIDWLQIYEKEVKKTPSSDETIMTEGGSRIATTTRHQEAEKGEVFQWTILYVMCTSYAFNTTEIQYVFDNYPQVFAHIAVLGGQTREPAAKAMLENAQSCYRVGDHMKLAVQLLERPDVDINAMEAEKPHESAVVGLLRYEESIGQSSLLCNRLLWDNPNVNWLQRTPDGQYLPHLLLRRTTSFGPRTFDVLMKLVKRMVSLGWDVNAHGNETLVHQMIRCTNDSSYLRRFAEAFPQTSFGLPCRSHGYTPLQLACSMETRGVVIAFLLTRPDVNINHRVAGHVIATKTALMHLLENYNPQKHTLASICDLLRDKRLDVNVTDVYGNSALARVIMKRRGAVRSVLVDQVLKMRPDVDLDLVTSTGKTIRAYMQSGKLNRAMAEYDHERPVDAVAAASSSSSSSKRARTA